ncbi:MAG: UDP-N-acetylmuramate dehydrogenase [bacterium]|nr:UDP-N-acetylmuramate dehydrogenase [bacterium]
MPDIDLHKHYPMKELTTFKIGGPSRYLIDIHFVNELFEALRFLQQEQLQLFVLGGGSNTLVHDRGFQGLVLKMSTRGIELLEEDCGSVVLKVAAGEPWDELVAWAGEQGWWGIENLSYIPGNTGALAIQNVGAYGQEAGQVVEGLEVCEISTGETRSLTREECRFAYRKSIFNSTQREKYIILNTRLRLKKASEPNLVYRALRNTFADTQSTPTLQSVRKAVISIRREKLPDPSQIGNAGSFFKNCVLPARELTRCCRKVQETLGNDAREKIQRCELRGMSEAGERKIPIALLLDICGLKAFQHRGAALYHKHPSIVINQTGSATAADVMELTRYVRQCVYDQTGIRLTPEPKLLGFAPEELREYFGL